MVGYFFLRIFVELFRLIPFSVLYVLSDGMAFLLYRVIGYRKAVVYSNLRRAFPEKDDQELQRISRLFYQSLTDVTLETFKSFTTSAAEIERRCPCRNPEIPNQYLDRGQPIILTGSHLGNWEYSGLSLPPALHGPTITAYKALKNKSLESYLNNRRSRTGMTLIGMDEVFKVMRQRNGEPAVYILLADQSPSNRKSAHWVPFFGQDTATLPGADVLARKFNYPVVHYVITRIRRGFYEIHFKDLSPESATAAEMDITKAFSRQLEQEITAHPEQWLWSHKRWKITREGVE